MTVQDPHAPSTPSTSSWVGSKVFWATVIVLITGIPSFLQETHIVEFMPPWVQKTLLSIAALVLSLTPILNRVASELAGKNQDAKTDNLARKTGVEPKSL